MTSPRRWLDDGAPPEIRRLLQAAQSEAPDRRVVERSVVLAGAIAATSAVTNSVLGAVAKSSAAGAAASTGAAAAVGAGSTATTVGAAGIAAKVGASSLGWLAAKWGAGAIFCLGLATTTVATVRHYSSERALPPVVAATSVSVAQTVPGASRARLDVAAATERLEEPSGTAARDESASAARGDPAARDVAASTGHAASAAATSDTLPQARSPQNEGAVSGSATRAAQTRPRTTTESAPPVVATDRPPATIVADAELFEEMRYLDAARAAWRAGRAVEARRWIDAYRTECKTQRMLPESMLLRMQIEKSLGDRAAAVEVARRIVSSFPNSPHASHATQLLKELGDAQEE